MDKREDKIITEFLSRLKDRFSPVDVILFGSRATGDEWKRSDYDFIIVSRAFEGMHWLDRIAQVVNLWEPLVDIDVLPYTPEEFERMKEESSVVRHAVREGKRLAVA